jgi:hypothetical protein
MEPLHPYSMHVCLEETWSGVASESPQYSEQDCSLKSAGLMAHERRDFFFA